MNKKAFSPIEEIIVLIMISIFIAVIYHRYNVIAFKAKTSITKIDLYNIGLTVKLFKIKKGRYPKSLYQLYKSGYLENMIQKSRFHKKSLLDPFGNAYLYDNKTGSVSLSKKTESLIDEK